MYTAPKLMMGLKRNLRLSSFHFLLVYNLGVTGGILGSYRGYMEIMEKNMETTIL